MGHGPRLSCNTCVRENFRPLEGRDRQDVTRVVGVFESLEDIEHV